MKTISKILSIAAIAAVAFTACKKDSSLVRDVVPGTNPNIDTLKNNVTGTVNLVATKTYIIKGIVTIKSGAVLNIPAGTTLKGFGAAGQKGVLLVARGGRLNSNGTVNNPVIFTSNQATPANGDWGGIIVLGSAPTNKPTTTTIEGIPASSDTQYGGANANDNSGNITYTRVEYAGGVYQGAIGNNNEVNGLTFGGVGAGTLVDHVQVSYSGDDSFEFFGGTVNPKYLISYRAIDDDFDFDFGYQGSLQFLLALRDPEINDQSKSNGIECDNDNTGIATNTPRTRPVISNLTILGNNGVADSNPDFPVTSATGVDGSFQAGAHFRRNTGLKVRNSIFLGFPAAGLLIDGNVTADSLTAGTSEFRKNFVHSNAANKAFAVATGTTSYTDATLKTFLTNATNTNVELATASAANLVNPFNLTSVNSTQFFINSSTAAAASGADFTSSSFASSTSPVARSKTFLTVAFRGAFAHTGATGTGTGNWATVRSGSTGWTKF
ncbi:T9SS C-terminal target domain-containing protein [Mucilaginibacter sp. JRF]|uniref:T9SS C-terminal target domain-containing protein n=1 Tax=Mucilaginibacter sp. JRF TaxID=2780088 RepID=UPI0018828303|nr:T9SS C-terminal target domain-containing protein [Mucilaginibacter sp. JRF]MBE9583160.1 T9SS C-terminal target domain-containing protein [Mucilaginibacter sp. JRF]